MVIYKYHINTAERDLLNLPIGAEILSVQVQNGRIYLWALVDEMARLEPRLFAVYGTGNKMPNARRDVGKFLATLQLDGFVWHVFELESAE